MCGSHVWHMSHVRRVLSHTWVYSHTCASRFLYMKESYGGVVIYSPRDCVTQHTHAHAKHTYLHTTHARTHTIHTCNAMYVPRKCYMATHAHAQDTHAHLQYTDAHTQHTHAHTPHTHATPNMYRETATWQHTRRHNTHTHIHNTHTQCHVCASRLPHGNTRTHELRWRWLLHM